MGSGSSQGEQRDEHSRAKSPRPDYLDLSRPVDKTQEKIGNLVFKEIEPGKLWPFFSISQDGNKKEYKIESSEETFKSELSKCKDGQLCSVRGEFFEGETPLLVARSIKKVSEPDPYPISQKNTIQTKSGRFIFKRIEYGVLPYFLVNEGGTTTEYRVNSITENARSTLNRLGSNGSGKRVVIVGEFVEGEKPYINVKDIE